MAIGYKYVSATSDDLVSVIIPVYNSEKYIKRCIQSILKQTHKNIELIVVDDGSTDNSSNICHEFQKIDNRIRYFYINNSGPANARNFGIKKMSGDYLMFVDSDDFLVNTCIENCLSEIQNNKADMVIFNWTNIDLDNAYSVKSNIGSPAVMNAKDIRKQIIKNDEMYGGGYPWNRIIKVKESIPLFHEKLFAYEDKLWVLSVLASCDQVILADFIGYNYCVSSQSLSHNYSFERLNNVLLFLALARENYKDYNDYDSKIEKILSENEIYILWNLIFKNLQRVSDIKIYNVPCYFDSRHIGLTIKSQILFVISKLIKAIVDIGKE